MVFCAIRTPQIECPKTRVASHATSIIPALVTKNCKISFRDNVNISSRRRDKRKTSRKHQDRSKAVRPSAALVRRICGSPGDAAPWGRVTFGGGGDLSRVESVGGSARRLPPVHSFISPVDISLLLHLIKLVAK